MWRKGIGRSIDQTIRTVRNEGKIAEGTDEFINEVAMRSLCPLFLVKAVYNEEVKPKSVS